MNAVETKPLDYAARPHRPPLSRRIVVRILWCALAFVVATMCARLIDTVPYLWWQHKAIASQPTAQTVVHFDSQPHTLSHAPETALSNEWFGQFSQKWIQPGRIDGGTIFVGTLTTPAGFSRIVGLRTFKTPSATADPINHLFFAQAYTPASLWIPPTERIVTSEPGEIVPAGDSLKIFAGKIDPADPAHLTFDCEMGKVMRTYDVWLLDDAARSGQVKLAIEPRAAVSRP